MSSPTPPRENLIVNLACNVVIPGVLLSKGGDWLPFIAPAILLVIALAFPVAYFLLDYARRRVANPISVLGFAGTLVSGAIGLMKLDPQWFAIKEAAFPFVIGAVMYLTQFTGRPLVKAFLWNDTLLDTGRIEKAIAEKGAKAHVDALFNKATRLLAPAFFVSAVAHYSLARGMVKAHPEIDAKLFNEQLGSFNLLAWPTIILPSFIYLLWLMFRFMKRLREVSGLTEDEIYRS